MSYRGKNLIRIYKANNKNIIDKRKDVSAKELKGCLDKMGYDSEFEATVHAAKKHMYSYKCLYCPHYHLTSKRSNNGNQMD